MTTRYDYLKWLATRITDELVICNVAGATVDWAHLNPRAGNLYSCWMSGSAPMALGLALALPKRKVVTIDGDGSMLMGLAALPTIAYKNPPNLVLIIFDNGHYEPQKVPTFTSARADLLGIARAAGIENTWLVKRPPDFEKAVDEAFKSNGASFIQVKVQLPSPPVTPSPVNLIENKFQFLRYIEKTENIQIITGTSKLGRT